MTPTEPLPLYHSWPLVDLAQRFDLGHVLDETPDRPATPARTESIDRVPGYWTCELVDNHLHWSPAVYDLFGLPADVPLARTSTVALYDEGSRAAMERLRAHAIRHRRGFTIDIDIRPVGARQRWVRLVAAPVCEDGRVVRLHGYKADVSDLYRRR